MARGAGEISIKTKKQRRKKYIEAKSGKQKEGTCPRQYSKTESAMKEKVKRQEEKSLENKQEAYNSRSKKRRGTPRRLRS